MIRAHHHCRPRSKVLLENISCFLASAIAGTDIGAVDVDFEGEVVATGEGISLGIIDAVGSMDGDMEASYDGLIEGGILVGVAEGDRLASPEGFGVGTCDWLEVPSLGVDV